MPFGNEVTGGQGALVRPAIKSPNYVAGSAGWSINRTGSAEFNNATIRGELDLGSASPSPRVAINPNIPAVLSGWSVNVTFNVVILWYFNSTDFYWQGIGTFFGTKSYMEGTYDTTNGPYMINRVLQPGASSIEERVGSYFLNAFTQVWKTQQTQVLIGDGSNIGDSLTVNGPLTMQSGQEIIGGEQYAELTGNLTLAANSTTFQDVLTLGPCSASGVYSIDVNLAYNENNTAKLKTQWVLPTGATLRGRNVFGFIGGGWQGNASVSGTLNVDGFGGDLFYWEKATLVMSTTAGTVKLQAAQQVANATAPIIKSGTTIRAKRQS
jgi:hypothetical protein